MPIMIQDPAVGITGNFLILAAENFMPPVFPVAGWWNVHVRGFFPAAYAAKLRESFTPDFLHLRELQAEETAGLGFGVSWLVVGGLLVGWVGSRKLPATAGDRPRGTFELLLLWSPYVALAVFMVKSGILSAARILGPYYALLLAALVAGAAQERVVRARWWLRASLGVYLLAFAVLALAPERPLWPAQSILGALQKCRPENPLLRRAARVYSVYHDRYDVLGPLRDLLPPDARNVGMLCLYDEAGTSLWRPFGQRRVRQVLLTDRREDLARWGIEYIVARDLGPRFEAWVEQVGARKMDRRLVDLYAAREPMAWYVLRLARPADPGR